MDAEQEMLTSDGLGAALKAELRDVLKDKGFKLFDDHKQELEEGDEVHLEGYSQEEGRGIVTHVGEPEEEGYVMITVFFYADDRDEYFQCYSKSYSEGGEPGWDEFVASEFEKQ